MNEPSVSPLPVVSVIVPVYNVRELLPETLDCILAQDCGDWECICVNDGSTDGSDEVIRAYAARDARIRLVSQSNGGLAAARNRGMDEARGEFIAFVDADDWIAPSMFGTCVTRMREDMSDLCAFEVVAFDAVTHESLGQFMKVPLDPGKEHGSFTPLERQGELFEKIPASAWNKMYRASLLHQHGLRFPESLRRSEDTPFGAWCLALAGRISCVAQPFYQYRQNREGSLMRTLDDESVCYCYIDAAKEIWRGLQQHGKLESFGVDGLLLTLANACWYHPFLGTGFNLLRGTWRLRRWVNARLRELKRMGVTPEPELFMKIRHYMSVFTRSSCQRCLRSLLHLK